MKNSDYPPEGGLIFTIRNKEYCRSYSMLEKAMDSRVILEGKAFRCDENHDLHVRLPGGITGVIPYEDCMYDSGKKLSREIAVISRVGKTVCFKVSDINQRGVILSRKAAQRECMNECIGMLEPGDIIDAVITHLEQFGAFCDIGCGIVSLLPIDAMSVSRIAHPSDRFLTGQKILAIVKTACDEDERVSLTHKELLGTWEENASMFPAGQAVTGIIRSVEKYGIFVELAPNLAGLAEYREGFDAGDHVSVYIKSVIPQKMKIKLVIIDKAEREKPDCRYEYRVDPDTDSVYRWKYSPDSCPRIVETVFQNMKSN